jgi:hypothetical protein
VKQQHGSERTKKRNHPPYERDKNHNDPDMQSSAYPAQAVRKPTRPRPESVHCTMSSLFLLFAMVVLRESKEQTKQPAVLVWCVPVPVRPSCQLPCSLPQNQSRHTRPTTARCSFACTEIGTRRCDRSFSLRFPGWMTC